MSHVDRIRWQCRIRPHEPALALPGPDPRIVTYDRLEAALNNAGRRMRELDVFNATLATLETAAHLDLLAARTRISRTEEDGEVRYAGLPAT